MGKCNGLLGRHTKGKAKKMVELMVEKYRRRKMNIHLDPVSIIWIFFITLHSTKWPESN